MSAGDRRVAAIVLAAGASTRLGRPKQLEPGPGGVPLLRHAALVAREATGLPAVVGVGCDADRVRAVVDDIADCVVVPGWREGPQATLRACVADLARRHAAADGAFLLVCDQPRLTPEVLSHLEDAWRRTGADAAAAHYDGVLGVPALFSRALWGRLGALPAGEGARSLLRDPALRIASVEWPDGAMDVDEDPPSRIG